MSVLRIEDTESPFEIASGAGGVRTMGAASAKNAAKVYAGNLVKLVPGEAFALYALGKNVSVPKSFENYHVWPFFCLVAVIAFRWAATLKPNSIYPQWGSVIISSLTFITWIYSEGSWFFGLKLSDLDFIFSYVLIFMTFVVPALAKKQWLI